MLDALAESTLDTVHQLHRKRGRKQGEAREGWIVVDYGDVVVHVFQPEERDFIGRKALEAGLADVRECGRRRRERGARRRIERQIDDARVERVFDMGQLGCHSLPHALAVTQRLRLHSANDLLALGDPAIDVGNFAAHIQFLGMQHAKDPETYRQ